MAALTIASGSVNSSGAESTNSASATSQTAAPITTGVDRFIPRPVWLTDLSVGFKEGYDNNVYLVSGDGTPIQSSWVSAVAPRIGVNFAPLMPDQKVLQILALGYAPEFVAYSDTPAENFNAQRLASTMIGKAGDFSFNLENSFNYIDGNVVAPTYPGLDSTRSVFATGAPRERRKQIQDRSRITLQYDWGKCFFRPTASFLYYDLMTELRPTFGYQNYADRYDVNGGADFGYRVTELVALTVGYRYGHQYQQQFPTDIDKTHASASNDYQRLLFGIEGKPWKWLSGSFQAGPDFRAYPPTTATHTTPLNNKNPVYFYGEAGITAEVSSKDTVVFKYKQWQWVASTGKLPYYDSLFDLTYRHKFNKSFSAELGGRIQSANYNCGNTPASLRDDWQYSVLAGATYNITAHLVANVSYEADFGRNAQPRIPEPQYRQFNRQLVALGAQLKF